MRYIITKAIYIVFALAEIILGLRFILKLFGANASNGFVLWVYQTSGSILDPFRGIFPVEVYKSTFVIEFSTLFAMILYAIIAAVLVYIVELITRPLERKLSKK